MRRASRIDGNHVAIVEALRQTGIAARSTAALAGGFPDLLAAFRNCNVLLEIKNGEKPPSERKLTKAEAEFFATWPGPVYVVTSAEEAVRVVVEAARPPDSRVVELDLWRVILGRLESGASLEGLHQIARAHVADLESALLQEPKP